MDKHTSKEGNGQGSRQQTEVVADLRYRFAGPLQEVLNHRMDRGLVQTFLDLLMVIVMHLNRNPEFALSELEGHLLGTGHTPAGVKRIGNLLGNRSWNSQFVDHYLWHQADRAIDERLNPPAGTFVIWDESVIEKHESLKAERLCAVRSSKARRLSRIKPGY